MDQSILPQDLTYRVVTSAKSDRTKNLRSRLPPIATFSHKQCSEKPRSVNQNNSRTVSQRDFPLLCQQPGCKYATFRRPFKFRCRLQQHMVSHQEGAKFKCSWCDSAFTTKENLNRHLFLHKNIKPYKCELCSRMFSRTSERSRCRKQHMKASIEQARRTSVLQPTSALGLEEALNHSKLRPYVCSICPDKSFTDAGSLRRHKRRHHATFCSLPTQTEQNISIPSAGKCGSSEFGRMLDAPHVRSHEVPPTPHIQPGGTFERTTMNDSHNGSSGQPAHPGTDVQATSIDMNNTAATTSSLELPSNTHFLPPVNSNTGEVALDLTDSHYLMFASDEVAIDLSGCATLGLPTPIDLSASHNPEDTSTDDACLPLLTDYRHNPCIRGLYPFTWEPEPGFSFTDLLTSAELDDNESVLPGFHLQEVAVNYSPMKAVNGAPPLDLRLVHPPFM